MRAFMRAFQFMRREGIPREVPGAGEVLVGVKAAGVGPWDRLVRDWLSACRRSSRKAKPPKRRRSTRLNAYIIADDGAQPTVFDK